MADTQVQKFDPSTLMEGVKDRIKSTFVSLIPDEQWEAMIQTEVNRFFTDTEPYGYKNKEIVPAPFKMLVIQVLTDEAKTRLKEYLRSSEFECIWTDTGKPICSSAVETMVIKNSGEIMKNVFGSMLQNALEGMRYRIEN